MKNLWILMSYGFGFLALCFAAESVSRGEEATIEVKTVCAGQAPHGWIKTNDSWNPTTCGKPTSIEYNVWTIEKYRHRRSGSEIRACAGPVPEGWVMINSSWNPSACGHPGSPTQNMMVIRRINQD